MATFDLWRLCPNEEFYSSNEWPILKVLRYYDIEDKFIEYWGKEFGRDHQSIEEILKHNENFDNLDPEDLLLPLLDMLPGTYAIWYSAEDDYNYIIKIYEINNKELLNLFREVFKVKSPGVTLESIEVALNV